MAMSGCFAIIANSSGSEAIGVAVTGETTAVAAGAGKFTFRMPYAMTVTAVRASLQMS